MRPMNVLIGVGGLIKELEVIISNPALPTIDLDVVLDYIVDSLSEYQTRDLELYSVGQLFIKDHVLGEKLMMDAEGDEEVSWAVDNATIAIARIGQHVLNQFKSIKLFEEGGHLSYRYYQRINEDSIILRRR